MVFVVKANFKRVKNLHHLIGQEFVADGVSKEEIASLLKNGLIAEHKAPAPAAVAPEAPVKQAPQDVKKKA